MNHRIKEKSIELNEINLKRLNFIIKHLHSHVRPVLCASQYEYHFVLDRDEQYQLHQLLLTCHHNELAVPMDLHVQVPRDCHHRPSLK